MAAAPPAERKALPALAEAVGFDLLQRYISSHSHRAKQRRSSRADASRSSTAAPPSRQSTSGSHGSSQRRSSTADTCKNAHVRLRHSCNAVWPLGVAATIGGLMAGISGDGLDELAQALGVDPASASKMCPVIAKDAELMLKDLTATSKSQHGIVLSTGSILGHPQGVNLSSTFVHSLRHRFAIEARALADAAALDLWTSTTTNAAMTSLIKDLPSSFAAYTADATRPVPVLLASVIAITGHWAPKNEFVARHTARDTFTLANGETSGCYMMRAQVQNGAGGYLGRPS